MVVRSCDGNIAAFYVMKESIMKIGRSQTNIIRSLEVSVEDEHSELINEKGRYFIRDKGTESGTFIKVTAPRLLKLGTLLEMGSFLIEVVNISYQTNTIVLSILHMMQG